MGEEARFVIPLRREARVTRFRQRERAKKESVFSTLRVSGSKSLGRAEYLGRDGVGEVTVSRDGAAATRLLARLTARLLAPLFPSNPPPFRRKKVPPRKGGTSRPAGDRNCATSETGSLDSGFESSSLSGRRSTELRASLRPKTRPPLGEANRSYAIEARTSQRSTRLCLRLFALFSQEQHHEMGDAIRER